MEPKIGIIITPKGIESVVVMNKDHKSRLEAYRTLPLVSSEISKFEAAFKRKLKKELDYVKKK